MMERLNASMMLRICDVFLKSFVAQATVADLQKEDFLVNKRQLYTFFDEYTEKIAKDWQIWRLIGRIKSVLRETFEEIKDLKFKEIRSLMIIDWEHQIDNCEKIERSLQELMKIYSDNGKEPNEDEKQYIQNTIAPIETALKRECAVKL